MFHYTSEQLASLIALPIVTVLLIWTSAIFHKNKDRWGPYDIPIVGILVLSIIRNLTVLVYTLVITLNHNTFDLDYCSILIWLLNSIHTFQASSLTTLAVIGLFSIRLSKKQQSIRQFLTATHLVYHLFCLMTLCACVGVAAILAQDSNGTNLAVFTTNPCKFMPFDLDVKYNIFIIVLHTFLASVSVIAFLAICMTYLKVNDFDYVKKTASDMSLDKNYYDSYARANQSLGYEGHAPVWNSDLSNVSTTVSSTNSRRPCLNKPMRVEEERTGLETIHPVLIVCYLFYHLPLIVLCIYPSLIKPWPVAGVALWLGLIQDVLIPIGLSIVDSRFCKWVGNVYNCSSTHSNDKLPHVGLDGKFRPFGSQPQSLDPAHHHVRQLQTIEHRFPITNGSLYTSIDGRLPVIHNYRRHHKMGVTGRQDVTSHLQAQSQLLRQVSHTCRSCDVIAPDSNHVIKNSRNLVRLNRMRLTKSEDSLANQTSSDDEEGEMTQQFDSISSKSSFSITTEANCDFEFYGRDNSASKNCAQLQKYDLAPLQLWNSQKMTSQLHNRYVEEPKKHTQLQNCELHYNKETQLRNLFKNDGKVLNGYQEDGVIPIELNTKLYNVKDVQLHSCLRQDKQLAVNYSPVLPRAQLQRSNSYTTLEDRNRRRNCKKLLRSDSKLSDCTSTYRQKIKSVEYLPSSNASTVFIEDVYYFNYPNKKSDESEVRSYVGSVPDLKKVFISEYI